MPVNVRIPTPLRRLTDGQSILEADGGSVAEIILNLDSRFPGIRDRLYDGGAIKPFINIYLNDEDIRFLGGEGAGVKDGDQLSIVPAIAGGIGRR